MQRRTILQLIAAFFASFASWFGFRREQPFELVQTLKPRGVVSPKARWFLSPTQEAIPDLNPDRVRELTTAIQNGSALFPPPTRSKRLRTPEPAPEGPYFKPNPELVLEPQEGVEVMRLKNSALQRTLLGVDPGGPPPEYVTPTRPVAPAASRVWEPLAKFIPTPSHPALTPMGTVLGTLRSSAISPRVNIANDEAFRSITGRKLGDAPEILDSDVQARIDANLSELLEKWEGQKFDPTDVESAEENALPAYEAFLSARLNRS